MGSILGGGGGGGSSTTVTKADPWSGIQPQLKQAAADATNLYNQGKFQQNYYPGSTVVGYSPETEAALRLTTNRALAGSPVTNSAKGLLTDTLEGSYLNNNPHLDATFNKAADAVEGRVNSAFAGGGRFGGGLNQRTLGDSLGGLATDIYGGNYENERNRQMQSMLFAPQMAEQDFSDFQRLSDVGKARESLSQAQKQEDIDRFNFNQTSATNGLTNYADLLQRIGGTYGASTATGPKASTGGGLLGTLGGLTGIGSSGIGILSGLKDLGWLTAASDIRLKEDIHPAGEENGFKVYTFKYKGRPETFRGVMAHEVREKMPEAVVTLDGYDAVNYGMIGVKFSHVV